MKTLAILAATGAVAAAATLHVTLTVQTTKPKAGAHWPYKVTATSGGKPAKGTVTAQIVDPLGGVHAVQFGANSRYVTRIPFTGTFKDYVIWPKDSIGYPLKFRVIVRSGGVKKIASVTVTVQK
jgi:hypothetical protein